MGIICQVKPPNSPCREKIKEGLNIIMSGDEKQMNNFIQDFRKSLWNYPEDIVSSSFSKWSFKV